MKRNSNPEPDHGVIDAILDNEEELIPSSGFLAATMERVREEAAMPKPISFPWRRALPGMVVAGAVLCWCGFEAVRASLAPAPVTSFNSMHDLAAEGRALEPAGWVALTLIASMLSWLLSRRLAGRSGLL